MTDAPNYAVQETIALLWSSLTMAVVVYMAAVWFNWIKPPRR